MSTQPLDEGPAEATQSITMRLPTKLIEAMDARSKNVNLNRTQWTVRSLTWVLTYLPTGIKAPERDEVATKAPAEVTGTRRELAETPLDRTKRLAGRPTGYIDKKTGEAF